MRLLEDKVTLPEEVEKYCRHNLSDKENKRSVIIDFAGTTVSSRLRYIKIAKELDIL